ncbi:Oxygen tolerance [Bosea sp. CRIB-10]|uniref:BatD family protein n=1 Tax=Bosea sp. CRIB-10 TaxID=378404 RepID=UPI0008EE8EBB|nr:BatD family protein [Bosea sp. CRIB-10]SFD66614.1 Oxygen tolerance [Bosea sp. CRIB-10]
MIRGAIALALVFASAMAWAQVPAGQPLVRTKLIPAEGVVIGQPVRLDVEVLFPGDMSYPPLASVPEAKGAQIMRFETQATTIRDRIDGQDYVGKTFEFTLFPRRGGEIAIPAPHITVLDKNGDPTGSVEGQATRLDVAIPAGIDPSGPVLVADAVNVTQSWSPNPGGQPVKAGAAITRTITRQADGVPALGMADFQFTAPEGVRVYVDPPAVDDRMNRGSVEGHRTDKVTYVFEKAGQYQLPALVQPWWSLAAKQARTEELAGLAVTVTAAAGPATNSHPSWRPGWLIAGLAVLALAGLAVLSGGRLTALRRRLLAERQASEAFARKQLQAAAQSGSADATYRAFSVWRGRLAPGEAARLHGDATLAPLLAGLEQALFGAGDTWTERNGEEFAGAIRHWQPRAVATSKFTPLPSLNPRHDAGRPSATR